MIDLTSKYSLDIEAVFPFQFLAILIWFTGVVSSWKSAVLFISLTLLLAQMMLLTRTLSKIKGAKLAYLALNEIYAIITISAIYILQIR